MEVYILEHRGFIFDSKNNVIIVPGRKTISTIARGIFDYDFTILNDVDPLIQMNLLRQEAILIKLRNILTDSNLILQSK